MVGDVIFGESVNDTSEYYSAIHSDGTTVDIGGTCNFLFGSNSDYEIIYAHINDYWVKVGDGIDVEIQYCQEFCQHLW